MTREAQQDPANKLTHDLLRQIIQTNGFDQSIADTIIRSDHTAATGNKSV